MDAITDRKASQLDPFAICASFQMPQLGFPKMEVPEALRGFLNQGAAQAKDMFEKAKTSTEQATNALESSYSCAADGAATYNLKLFEMARTNVTATFDYVQALLGVTDFNQLMKLSTEHAQDQMAVLSEQTKALTELVRKTANAVSEPFKTETNKVFSKA
jgi:phasin